MFYAIIWQRTCKIAAKEDAEECVSDVFAEAFLHYPDIRDGALQGYLATLVNRRAIDFWRWKTVRGEAALPLEESAVHTADPQADIEAISDANAQSTALLEAIRSLGEPDATIILHKYFYDRSAAGIAKTVGMQPVTVRVRLSRALTRRPQKK